MIEHHEGTENKVVIGRAEAAFQRVQLHRFDLRNEKH